MKKLLNSADGNKNYGKKSNYGIHKMRSNIQLELQREPKRKAIAEVMQLNCDL